MASIFKIVKKVNILILENRIDPDDALKITDAFRNINSVLKIFDFQDEFHDPEIDHLIKQRDNARLEKNWDLADKIRDQLKAMGITIKDKKLSN